MAEFNRPRIEIPPFGGGYANNDFRNDHRSQVTYPPMRNYNDNISRNAYDTGNSQYPHFPAHGNYYGRPQFPVGSQMRGPDPFNNRPRPPSNGPQPNMFHQPPFQRHEFHRNEMVPRMRMPGKIPGERFFVPWNQGPNQFLGPSPPSRFVDRKPDCDQKPSVAQIGETTPKKKKNKKYHPRPREDAKRLKPWMTDEIYDEVRRKNELYLKAKKEDKPELWQEFKVLRNQVSSMVKDAKTKVGLVSRKIKDGDGIENPYSCDTCDRAFFEESQLEKHLKEHIQCAYEGCSFMAHPKVVDLHKRMLHETGYADVILKLNNSEEVQKWRDERKSHYPTAENIKKRKAELAEKIARGEILETEQFGMFKRPRLHQSDSPELISARSRTRRRGRGKKRAPAVNNAVIQPPVEVLSDPDSDIDSHINLPRFAGFSIHEKDTVIPSQSDTSPQPIEEVTLDAGNEIEAPKEESPQSGLAQCNIDISEPGDEEPSMETTILSTDDLSQTNLPVSMDVPIITLDEEFKQAEPGDEEQSMEISTSATDDLSPRNSHISMDVPIVTIEEEFKEDSDDEGPSEEPILKSELNGSLDAESTSNDFQAVPADGSTQLTGNTGEEVSICENNQSTKIVPERQILHSRSWPSGMRRRNLLDKLLANEVRHERNVILQCIRHIVNNNFFGLE